MRMPALLAAALLALPAAAQTVPSLPAGPPVTLQIVTQPGPAFPQYTRVDQPILRDAMRERSNGRVTTTLASWPERNLNGPEIIRLVRSGQVDIGAAPLNTLAGDVPLLDVFDLAGLNPTLEQARRVAAAVLPEANRELERFGVRIIAAYPFPAQVFFCREPVASLAELRGKRVRTGGGSINDFVSAIGAQPVGIGFPEVYAALERGVVDCAITGTASGNSARWYEVTRGLYALPVAWSTSGYLVNLAWWNRLDPAVRGFIEAHLREVEEAQWRLGAETTEDGIACNAGQRAECRIGRLVEGRTMTVARPGDADIAAVRATLSANVLPGWVRRCGERCGQLYDRLVAPVSGVAR
ncbi:TRAP transporter substrate-binding protein [Roseococcus sp. DSY-14]|uniref:TRAP transporter substrate-binding protein n=1 Tax=Roseococcus sp. DSY-14 TaxID=3369650 RepID=UPI00387AEF39